MLSVRIRRFKKAKTGLQNQKERDKPRADFYHIAFYREQRSFDTGEHRRYFQDPAYDLYTGHDTNGHGNNERHVFSFDSCSDGLGARADNDRRGIDRAHALRGDTHAEKTRV